jgi:uncharacterized protein
MHLSVVISGHRRWLCLFFAWLFIALMFPAGPALADPSFDCRKSSKPDEQAICGSAELSALERSMAEKFTAARALGDANQIRDFARDLLKQRRGCQADVACIRDVLSRAITLFDSQRFGQTEPKQSEQKQSEPKQDTPKPAQSDKPSTFAFEFKEETPTERCDVAACNADCAKYYGSPDGPGDYGPLPIAVCQSMCADQKPFCLAHDGVAIQAPDIAPSSMGKLETLFCAKNKGTTVCQGVQ